MSGHQEYECTRCGFQWESLEPYNGCPKCNYDAQERPKEPTRDDLLARVKELEGESERLKSHFENAKAERDELKILVKRCRECLRHESIFLEDYLRHHTHPGVSRLVGSNHEVCDLIDFI